MTERTTLETWMGDWFDFANPDPETIKIADIGRALSLVCRFGGLIDFPYSVAQHALLVRQLVIDSGHSEYALAALHHDSHETFLGDVPTPLKTMFGSGYHMLVRRIDIAIGDALGVDPDDFDAAPVRAADELALRIEAAALKPSRGIEGAWPWRSLPPACGYEIVQRDPDEVAREFVMAHAANYEVLA